jgi:hypothetical protein
MLLTSLLLALSVAAPGPSRALADTTKASKRPPAMPAARPPTADRGKPLTPRPKPTGEPQLKRRKPPA